MKYRIPTVVERIAEGEYMARAEIVRATATGSSPEKAIDNLKSAISLMVDEYGEKLVFKDLDDNSEYTVVEVVK